MPSINRIRVNNVKYNFGTQSYDDFTMRMYGKNTLYDLANGGGKSILMLLLLQNLIPNCTLDDKQPIEKLFRTGGGNTVIHSLVEWKLDDADKKDGYRYMTTGFCARKAKDADGENVEAATASVEYFNYCIFYRDYNKNDIVNLPLSEGENRITYSGLKSYLKDLSYRDMGLEIKVFERKGEYQRFISQYGLFESHWEIIRGINKTEGHVRTYFENHYKTTRKVVEDLLIEEIIEKAFLTRTGRDAEDSEMAETLLDIKDKLNVLASRKRDIAAYDHQIELINVLLAKVNSCISQYQEHGKICKNIADIYATGKALSDKENSALEELLAAKNHAFANKEEQKKRLESLKITRDNLQLEALGEALDKLANDMAEKARKMDALKNDMAMKESMNDYQEYARLQKEIAENEKLLDMVRKNEGANHQKMSVYAYNRKLRDDVNLKKLLADKEEVSQAEASATEKYSYAKKCYQEAQVSLAIAKQMGAQAQANVAALTADVKDLTSGMELLTIGDGAAQLAVVDERIAENEKAKTALSLKLENDKNEINELALSRVEKQHLLENLEAELASQKLLADEFEMSAPKLKNIMTVYGVEDEALLEDAIDGRIQNAFAVDVRNEDKLAKLMAKKKNLQAGILFETNDGAKSVMDYISTRHGKMAMQGADYLAALPVEARGDVLAANPLIPYAVLVKGLSDMAEDVTLKTMDTAGELVLLLDMDDMAETAFVANENGLVICKDSKYFTEENVAADLLANVDRQIKNLMDESAINSEKVETYKEDLAWAKMVLDPAHLLAKDLVAKCSVELAQAKLELEQVTGAIASLNGQVMEGVEQLEKLQAEAAHLAENKEKLVVINDLTEKLVATENDAAAAKNVAARAEADVSRLENEITTWQTNAAEERSKLAQIANAIEDISNKWQQHFKPYYLEGKNLEILTISDEELELDFMAMHKLSAAGRPDVEDKERLVAALTESMNRIANAIKKRGVELADILALEKTFVTSEEDLAELSKERARLDLVAANLGNEKANVKGKMDRLSGNIDYAMASLKKLYGEDAYAPEDITLSACEAAISNGDMLLSSLESKYADAAKAYDAAYREQGYMLELFKDVKRIVVSDDMDVSGGAILENDKENLREIFEASLMKYDRSRKTIEKLKNELMRFKGQTAEALSEMKVYEMAETIRRDVVVPETHADAVALLDNLMAITEFIKLEKERVEKGIEDMVAIKENFCNQCIQRCMDVKTELEKLPKLSRITMNDEVIRMVDLSIPYVKDSLLSARMSDYIDDVVKGADTFEDERKRIKFIRDQLALKRLFSVMVTDMNSIKMKLYKRERIREQSRYLRYEEAVGSTGQSQGIYIQFLVAIINYIAGMYSAGSEDDISAKTIFIDNPFGAAKDVYIWEPIFAMLAANNVQLIVPARGATPAITARFDVNYVLGQQMVGAKQQTVVIDYTSKTNQEELEYQEVSYEQATFDFI